MNEDPKTREEIFILLYALRTAVNNNILSLQSPTTNVPDALRGLDFMKRQIKELEELLGGIDE